MKKVNGIRKAIALLLSILIAIPLLGLSAFAGSSDTFARLWTYSNLVNAGQYWYNCRELADATGTSVYRYDADYYLSEDLNTIKIVYTVDDETVTELRTRDADAAYFEYLYLLPDFVELPTSPDGLKDGDYWYYKEALVNYERKYTKEENMYQYTDASFYLSVDGTILRKTYKKGTGTYVYRDDEFILDKPGTMYIFLRQVGVDPNPGFNRLPVSDAGLEQGAYWFDAASFIAVFDTDVDYQNAEYYLSDDGSKMRVILGGVPADLSRGNGPFLFGFLRQAGVESVAGFTRLPVSDEGLSVGDWWFDAAALAEALGSYGASYLTAAYYLNGDASIVCMIRDGDITDEVSSSMLTPYLHQYGIDPNAGFNLLPTSADGLSDGDYWFDVETMVAAGGAYGYIYRSAEFYLSDDGETLRMILFSDKTEVKRSEGGYLFNYLRQVGVDPNAGFTLLPTSSAGLSDGDYWYDVAGLAAVAGDSASLYQNAEYYLSDDGETLRIDFGGNKLDIKSTDDIASTFFGYLRRVGGAVVHFNLLPTSDAGLSDGDYWFDAAGLADAIGDPEFANLAYYLSDDAQTLRFVYGGQNIDIAYTDKDADEVFPYLHRVGEVVMVFNLLPTSPAGLADDDYWFDADGFAAAVNQDAFLSATYYLSEDAQTLRIVLSGQSIEFSAADEEASLIFPYLHRAGDPVAVFTLLPTSEEGLADGTYWYNAAGIAAAAGSDDYLNASYYLSDDEQTLRIRISGYSMDIPKTAEYASFYFAFLRRAGVNPYDGFNRLPISPDGLADGDYWYDAEALAAAFEEEDLLTAEYYLSDDAQTLRILMSARPTDVTAGSDEGAIFFAYLYQVGVDPDAGFEPLYLSEADAYCRGYVFDLDAYIDWYIEDFNATLVEQGKEPMTDEAEAKERADLREEILLYVLSVNPDAEKIKLAAEGQQIVFGSNSEMYAEIIPFITLFTSDNHEWGEWIADGGEETRTCTRCGATETRPIAVDERVLWAGYEQDIESVTVSEGTLPAAAEHTIYVIAVKGSNAPSKVQVRYVNGTFSFTRTHRSVLSITDVTYNGQACELWVIDRGTKLIDSDYTVVAKYANVSFSTIPDSAGATFTVATPAPAVDADVFSAEIAQIDPEFGYIVFDALNAPVITIKTGLDAQKVQLVNNDNGTAITFNSKNAVVTEGTLDDGETPCLVWTITRVFRPGDYSFSILVRTADAGLKDTGADIDFSVQTAAVA